MTQNFKKFSAISLVLFFLLGGAGYVPQVLAGTMNDTYNFVGELSDSFSRSVAIDFDIAKIFADVEPISDAEAQAAIFKPMSMFFYNLGVQLDPEDIISKITPDSFLSNSSENIALDGNTSDTENPPIEKPARTYSRFSTSDYKSGNIGAGFSELSASIITDFFKRLGSLRLKLPLNFASSGPIKIVNDQNNAVDSITCGQKYKLISTLTYVQSPPLHFIEIIKNGNKIFDGQHALPWEFSTVCGQDEGNYVFNVYESVMGEGGTDVSSSVLNAVTNTVGNSQDNKIIQYLPPVSGKYCAPDTQIAGINENVTFSFNDLGDYILLGGQRRYLQWNAQGGTPSDKEVDIEANSDKSFVTKFSTPGLKKVQVILKGVSRYSATSSRNIPAVSTCTVLIRTAVKGGLLGSASLTVNARASVPQLTISNETNAGRFPYPQDGDHLVFTIKNASPNSLIEDCHTYRGSTGCDLTDMKTDGNGNAQYRLQVLGISLGPWVRWVKINGVESNHVSFNVISPSEFTPTPFPNLFPPVNCIYSTPPSGCQWVRENQTSCSARLVCGTTSTPTATPVPIPIVTIVPTPAAGGSGGGGTADANTIVCTMDWRGLAVRRIGDRANVLITVRGYKKNSDRVAITRVALRSVNQSTGRQLNEEYGVDYNTGNLNLDDNSVILPELYSPGRYVFMVKNVSNLFERLASNWYPCNPGLDMIGAESTPAPTPTPTLISTGTPAPRTAIIQGRVWYDENGDGVKDGFIKDATNNCSGLPISLEQTRQRNLIELSGPREYASIGISECNNDGPYYQWKVSSGDWKVSHAVPDGWKSISPNPVSVSREKLTDGVEDVWFAIQKIQSPALLPFGNIVGRIVDVGSGRFVKQTGTTCSGLDLSVDINLYQANGITSTTKPDQCNAGGPYYQFPNVRAESYEAKAGSGPGSLEVLLPAGWRVTSVSQSRFNVASGGTTHVWIYVSR